MAKEAFATAVYVTVADIDHMLIGAARVAADEWLEQRERMEIEGDRIQSAESTAASEMSTVDNPTTITGVSNPSVKTSWEVDSDDNAGGEEVTTADLSKHASDHPSPPIADLVDGRLDQMSGPVNGPMADFLLNRLHGTFTDETVRMMIDDSRLWSVMEFADDVDAIAAAAEGGNRKEQFAMTFLDVAEWVTKARDLGYVESMLFDTDIVLHQ